MTTPDIVFLSLVGLYLIGATIYVVRRERKRVRGLAERGSSAPARQSGLPPAKAPHTPSPKPEVIFKTHTLEQIMEIPNSAETKGQLQLEYAWYKFATGKDDQTKTNK